MPSPCSRMRATATFADPCTGARKSTDGSGANSPRGIDHGQSGEAHVPPRWSGHRGRLVAPDESARFWKATPFRAVARVHPTNRMRKVQGVMRNFFTRDPLGGPDPDEAYPLTDLCRSDMLCSD